MKPAGIFGLASRQAEWLATRQKIIAENISHANLPGYKAQDVEPFEILLNRSSPVVSITNQRHLLPRTAPDGIQRTVSHVADSAGDGSVSVEGELMKSAEVRSGLEMNTAVVRAFHRMMLAAIKV